MSESFFRVSLIPFEPHTGGDDPMPVKRRLRDAILAKSGPLAIEEATRRLGGKKLRVDVSFMLWAGRPDLTDTRGKKDLDNLLKPLLDTLQGRLDSDGKEAGLGIITNDDLICEIRARKDIVREDAAEGMTLEIYAL